MRSIQNKWRALLDSLPITSEKTKPVQSLFDIVINQLNSTFFYLVSCDTNPSTLYERADIAETIFQELGLNVLQDLYREQCLTDYQKDWFDRGVLSYLHNNVLRMSQHSPRTVGSDFFSVTIVSMWRQSHCGMADRMFLIAGVGKQSWERFGPNTQLIVQDFVFDLHDRAGDPAEAIDIHLGRHCYMAQFRFRHAFSQDQYDPSDLH